MIRRTLLILLLVSARGAAQFPLPIFYPATVDADTSDNDLAAIAFENSLCGDLLSPKCVALVKSNASESAAIEIVPVSGATSPVAVVPIKVDVGTPGTNGSPKVVELAAPQDRVFLTYSFFTTTGPSVAGVGLLDASGKLTTTVKPPSQVTETPESLVITSSGASGAEAFGVEEFANKVDHIVYGPNGVATITQFDMPTPSSRPQGIAADPGDHSLWITEWNAGKIAHMTQQGVFTEFPVGFSASSPKAIVAGQNGMWLTEEYGLSIDSVGPTGQVIRYPVPSATYGDLTSIAVGPDQNVWFIEHLSRKVGRLLVSSATPDGHAQIDVESLPDSAIGQPFKLVFAGTKLAVIGGDATHTFLLVADVSTVEAQPRRRAARH